MMGIHLKTIAVVGSGGGGFIWHLDEHRHTHHQRPDTQHEQRAEQRNRTWIKGDEPEQVEHRGRVRCGQVLDPAKERRMAHFNGDIEHLVKREEHRNLDQHGPAAGDGIDLLGLVEIHHRLLHLLAVVAKPFLDLLHLGLDDLHSGHGRIRLVGKREEGSLDEHRRQQDSHTKIAEHAVEPVDEIDTAAW